MIIIGEKINSSSSVVKEAIEARDAGIVQELAKKQVEAGVSYIDINAGMFSEGEPEKLAWITNVVQEVVDVPFSMDSPNAKAMEAALKANKNERPIINSITNEKKRYQDMLPLVLEYNTRVIALCMDDSGMPETVEERILIADQLIEQLTQSGVDIEDIFIDPMVRPVGTGSQYGVVAIETIRKIKRKYPSLHVTCGVSNISFGIPARNLMNQAFLVAAMSAGMDSAILNPLDKKLMALVYATGALLGRDELCMDYQMKFREGLLEGS